MVMKTISTHTITVISSKYIATNWNFRSETGTRERWNIQDCCSRERKARSEIYGKFTLQVPVASCHLSVSDGWGKVGWAMWMILSPSIFGLRPEEGCDEACAILLKKHSIFPEWPQSEGQINTLCIYPHQLVLRTLKNTGPCEKCHKIEQSWLSRLSRIKKISKFLKVLLSSMS